MPRTVRGLAFAECNLRWNPFGELPLADWPVLAVADVAPLVAALRAFGCVQVVGEAGRGKTTHLLAARASFPGAPYVHIPEDGPAPRVPEDVPVLFLDESQRLAPRARARLFASVARRRAALALGTHEDHAAELSRAGLATTTLSVASRSPERLARIIDARIEKARRGPGPVPRVPTSAAAALAARHGDDVRAALGELYDVFQSLREVGDVQL